MCVIPVLVLGLSVTGCQKSSTFEKTLEKYLNRLSNSLDVENDDQFISSKLMTFPDKKQITHSIPPAKVNILQFLQLSQCDLQRLVGHRNSSLGKLMEGYHSLLYEYEFLVLADECLQSLAKDDSLLAMLDETINYKKNYAKQLHWNAIFANNDMRHVFSLGSNPLSVEQINQTPVDVIRSLESINAWLDQPSLEQTTLEEAFKTLASHKYIGELRLSMNRMVSVLLQADTLIQQRLQGRPLCLLERPNTSFETVNNVLQKFYIGEVQPLAAKLHQQGSTLFDLINKMIEKIEPTSAFEVYWQSVYVGKDSEWHRFDDAIASHTLHWQSLLKQCGRLPGSY